MLDLHDREWKDFRLLDYFRHEKGNQNNMAELRPGAFPLVSARNANNGYKDFVSENEKKHSFEGFCLTINNDGDGGAGISYYQPCKMLLDSHVTALYPKASMTEEILKFFSACITAQREKFGHGYSLNNTRLSVFRVMLPVDESGNPDYAFMEQYIKERERQMVQSYIDYTSENIQMGGGALPTLNEKEWKSFLISDIFDIFPGKRLVAADTTAGNRPFIGALDNNNGVARFVSDTNESLDKNVLGVNYNGNGMVIGFYHPYECIFSDDVKRFHLKHHEDNEFVLLFMKVAILQQKNKFGYLYKFNSERMANTGVMLPVDESGNPDYAFMEQYVKRVKETIKLQYLQGKMAVIV